MKNKMVKNVFTAMLLGVLVMGIVIFVANNNDGDTKSDKTLVSVEQPIGNEAEKLNLYKMVTREELIEGLAAAREKHGDKNDSLGDYRTEYLDTFTDETERSKYRSIVYQRYYYSNLLKDYQKDVMSRKYASYVERIGYAGINYLNVYGDFDEDRIEFDDEFIELKVYTDKGFVGLPQSEGFISLGNVAHVGYPILVPTEDEEGNELFVLYLLMYFDGNMNMNDLANVELDVTFDGKPTKKYSEVAETGGKIGEFNNELNSEFIYDFLTHIDSSPKDEDGNLNYEEITKYNLLNGGVIAYATIVEPSKDISSYNDNLYNVNVNGAELAVQSYSFLEEDALARSDTLGYSLYEIIVRK